MSFFDQVYQSLFDQKGEDGNNTIIHEVIERSPSYLGDFVKWKLQRKYSILLTQIRDAYELKKKGIDQQIRIHLLNSKYANGLAIGYSKNFSESDFSFLLDYFSEKIVELDYKIVNADRLIRDMKNYTQSVEKYFLKPKNKIDPPFDQKFGNILVELIRIDEKPGFLKISANVYNDSKYSEALAFGGLISKLLNEE